MRKSVLLLLFILFVGLQLFAQNQVDRLRHRLSNTNNTSSKLVLWDSIGNYYQEAGKYEQALPYYLKIVTEKVALQEQKARANQKVGQAYFMMRNFELAIEHLRRATEIGLSLNDNHVLTSSYELMGDVHMTLEVYNKAATFYRKAYRLYPPEDIRKLSVLEMKLADIFETWGDYSSAVDLMEKSLKKREQFADTSGVVMVMNRLGKLREEAGEFNKALDHYNQALVFQERLGITQDVSLTLHHIAQVYLQWKVFDKAQSNVEKALELDRKYNNHLRLAQDFATLGEIMMQKGNFKEALLNYQRSYEINKRQNSSYDIALDLNHIGNVYIRMNQVDRALEYLGESEKIAQAGNYKYLVMLNHKSFFEAYSAKLDFRMALSYHVSYAFLQSDLNNEASSKRIDEQKVKFETEKRIRDNEILRKESQMQKAQLEQYKSERNLLTIIFLLALSLAVILYFLNRGNTRNRKFLQSVINSITYPFMVINTENYDVEWANRVAQNKFGHGTLDTIKKDKLVEYIDPVIVKQLIDKARPELVQQVLYNSADKTHTEINYFPILDEKRRVTKIIQYLKDVTTTKEAEARLKRSNKLLIAQNKEIDAKNKIIGASLLEKDAMLKEIHHRVKNNLQVISSMFNLQLNSLKDEEARNALKSGQERVKSMALIHKMLYQTEDFGRIDFYEYLKQLCSNLLLTYKLKNRKVQCNYQADGILLNIETSIPLGLIINELVTNAFKYAFKNQENGVVNIVITSVGDSAYKMVVSDNGDGLPDGFKIEDLKSLGLKLVYILIKQIKGDFEYQFNEGANFIFNFKEISNNKKNSTK